MSELPHVQTFEEFERFALPIIKPFKSQFRATWFHEAGNKPARRDWLVKNLILARSFGIVYGPPGCGKSFLVSDLMLTCAASVIEARRAAGEAEWFGYRTSPLGVVYLVAEGSDDFVIRLHAWRQNQGIDPAEVIPFVFLPTSVDMGKDDADTKRLAEEIKGIDIEMRNRCGVGVSVVVVDTVSRALAGGNENASDVMGTFVKNCEGLKAETGASVLCVHHGGKEAGRGPRGHEALLGAADYVFEVQPRTEQQPRNVWKVQKLKAGAGGKEHPFTLRPMTVDEDEEGDPVTSCVVVSQRETEQAAGSQRERGYQAKQTEIEFLRVMTDMIEKKGVMPPEDLSDLPRNVQLVVRYDDVSAEFRSRYRATEQGDEDQVTARLRARWSRATKALLTNRVIGSKSPWLWMTGKKVRGVTLRGVIDHEVYAAEPNKDAASEASEPPAGWDNTEGL